MAKKKSKRRAIKKTKTTKRKSTKRVSKKRVVSKSRKSKRVRSKSRPRRETSKLTTKRKKVESYQSSVELYKSVIKLNVLKTIELDGTIYSKTILKEWIKERLKKPDLKKKISFKKPVRASIRVVFQDVHRKKTKYRKKDDKNYKSKRHTMAVSTSLAKIDNLKDFVGITDLLVDFVNDDFERYLKYTELQKAKTLTVDYIELIIYEDKKKNEKKIKKNKNRSKAKKRSKTVRGVRRRKS